MVSPPTPPQKGGGVITQYFAGNLLIRNKSYHEGVSKVFTPFDTSFWDETIFSLWTTYTGHLSRPSSRLVLSPLVVAMQ